MKITTHGLKEFIDIAGLEIGQICETLSTIGLEVEFCAPIELPKKVVIGRVLEKLPHPDAHKLSVCRVDIGFEVLQIVCGAKNVEKDCFVAVALSGASLSFEGKHLEIAPSKLRGVDSYGMLCSSVELGLPKTNDGILLLDDSIGALELGRELGEYDVFNGYVLEISLTPNRGDCLCVLGVARELKGAFNLSLKNQKEYLSTNQIGIGRKFQVGVRGRVDSSLLYKMVDFKHKITPLKMQLALAIDGRLKPSVVENYTEYVAYMTGVNLNAYGIDKLSRDTNQASNEILWLYVEKSAQGFEEVRGEEKLSIIGVGNAIKQELDSSESIIFEASYTDPTQISQLLFDNKGIPQDKELTYRSTRGSNPDLHLGINYLCLLLAAHTSCFIYDGMHEVKQNRGDRVVRTKFSHIERIIGHQIDREVVCAILKQLDFYLELKANDDSLNVALPPFRHDIQSEQDLAEEILRIYGVDKIPSKPHKMEEKLKITPAYLDYKNQRDLVRRALSHGFVECIHYLFYQRERLESLGLEVLEEDKELLNPITSELNTLRTSLLPALLDSAVRNHNFGYKSIKMCEVGSVYNKRREERTKIAFLVSGLERGEQYPLPKGRKWDFYAFAEVIGKIVGEFELRAFEVENLEAGSVDSVPLPRLFHPYQGAYIYVGGQKVGVIAKLHPSLAKEMELSSVFMCEMDLMGIRHPMFEEFAKLPTSFRDLTLIVDKNLAFSAIKEAVLGEKITFLKNLYPLDVFVENPNQVALSIRAEIRPQEVSLREEDISGVMQKILEILQERFGAKLKG